MNGENRPIGPAPLPDNSPPPGGPPPSPRPAGPPPPPTGGLPSGPPPPPPPQIDIRTMASDAESLKATGGLGTESKTFSPADLAKEPVFTSGITSPVGAPRAGASGKKLGLAAGAIAILVLAAAVGYFFVWPLFSGGETPQVTEITPPPTLPTETPAPAALAHQSLFIGKPTATEEVKLDSSAIFTQLQDATKVNPLPAGSIKEIVLNNAGNELSSDNFLTALLQTTDLESFLDSNFTAFIYYDAKGAWPGYVFKLKSDADLIAAATKASASIEKSTNLSAFYPESPGAPQGSWKTGSIGDIQTRYRAYSSPGASLNYGWVNNYLVISTSFDGFKKAIELLPSQ